MPLQQRPMTTKETDLLVSILNLLHERCGGNVSESGFGYDNDGVISTADESSLEDALQELWDTLRKQQPYSCALDRLKRSALKVINDYRGPRTVTLPTGDIAIDNDDAWLLIGREDGVPVLRDKRDQRLIEKGMDPTEADDYSLDTEDGPMGQESPLFTYDVNGDIFKFADELLDEQ